jgi:hypothetical protein
MNMAGVARQIVDVKICRASKKLAVKGKPVLKGAARHQDILSSSHPTKVI